MTVLWLWAPVVIQMALIFGASSISDPGPLSPPVSDKTLHFAAYAVLSLFMIRALSGDRVDGITWPRALLAVVLTTIYGASDEFHQWFTPGRTPDLLDLRRTRLARSEGCSPGISRGWHGPPACVDAARLK